MSAFWSAWIIGLTAACTILLCWLLFANRKSKNTGPNHTTGHSYDGIEEYDNPLPAWWFYLFVITIVFGVGYVIAYPGLGSYEGALGWSSTGELKKDQAEADAQYGPLFAKYLATPIPELAKDPAALKMGQRLFANDCAQCHGADANGGFGFPNLTDNDWLHGGEPTNIVQTITGGRKGTMPGWEAAIGDAGIQQVAAYVMTLGGRQADAAQAAAGEKIFGTFCAACHGPDGKGMQALGAPNLTDNIWLYGGSPLQIQQTVRGGRNGEMPPWGERLGAAKVHLLAAYVYSQSQAQ